MIRRSLNKNIYHFESRLSLYRYHFRDLISYTHEKLQFLLTLMTDIHLLFDEKLNFNYPRPMPSLTFMHYKCRQVGEARTTLAAQAG